VHEDVAPKGEGVAVYLRNDAAGGRANVCEDAVRFGVVAQGLEVEVVEGRALGFVERRAWAGYVLSVRGLGVGVPWRECVNLRSLKERGMCSGDYLWRDMYSRQGCLCREMLLRG
jgi:hypothetical protein